jgi:hypothetical protein
MAWNVFTLCHPAGNERLRSKPGQPKPPSLTHWLGKLANRLPLTSGFGYHGLSPNALSTIHRDLKEERGNGKTRSLGNGVITIPTPASCGRKWPGMGPKLMRRLGRARCGTNAPLDETRYQ